jgi:predicted nucleic-acid-binding Zn-ribbon protein
MAAKGQSFAQEKIMPQGKCPKCGSSNVIPDVSVLDPGRFGKGDGVLHAVVDERPKARLFKGEVQSRLEAVVCGDCGYTEFYAKEPGALLAAYRKQPEAR